MSHLDWVTTSLAKVTGVTKEGKNSVHHHTPSRCTNVAKYQYWPSASSSQFFPSLQDPGHVDLRSLARRQEKRGTACLDCQCSPLLSRWGKMFFFFLVWSISKLPAKKDRSAMFTVVMGEAQKHLGMHWCWHKCRLVSCPRPSVPRLYLRKGLGGRRRQIVWKVSQWRRTGVTDAQPMGQKGSD